MTHQEMIAVIAAHERGEKIEGCSFFGNGGWEECPCPTWNFAFVKYRVAKRSSPIAPGHNPDKLTEEQVGVDDGWRLLALEEIVPSRNDTADLNVWGPAPGKWSGRACGVCERYTYRTKKPPGYFLPKPKTKKRVPLWPEDIQHGAVIRFVGSPFWSLVLGVGGDSVYFFWGSSHVQRVSYDDLSKRYELSTDGGKTWKPCYKEIEE